jgi:hypothetical protein
MNADIRPRDDQSNPRPRPAAPTSQPASFPVGSAAPAVLTSKMLDCGAEDVPPGLVLEDIVVERVPGGGGETDDGRTGAADDCREGSGT